jgi:hypothetical protein
VLDITLVHGPRVLKPERHSHVAVGAKRCNKGRLNLIVLVESNLVITRVAIEEGQQFAAGVESTTSSMRGKPKGSLGKCLLRSV